MPSQIKVFVVDDSAVVRQTLSSTLAQDKELRVIGSAPDPVLAYEKMKVDWPDVITLDVEMPKMDGITFLKQIMAERPTPVVICSTLTEKGASTTMQALAAGAVSFVTKPTLGLRDFLTEQAPELIRQVKAAAISKPRVSAVRANIAPVQKAGAPSVNALSRTTEQIVAIGTSTGGTQALEQVLTSLPRVCPGIVIVQHMPEKFTGLFADRLNQICQIDVREAKHKDRVLPGLALIAPGGKHMQLTRSGAIYQVDVVDGPPVNRHKPSVDVLFRSVAQIAGANALGIIMTGMGDDGARGLLAMHDQGAPTVAQDEASCVVFGMPMEAIKLGAADKTMPLDQIANEIVRFTKERAA